ncbi:MAG: undecaprenyl-diphosphate phosphatase [Kiritimatiellales bacterium]
MMMSRLSSLRTVLLIFSLCCAVRGEPLPEKPEPVRITMPQAMILGTIEGLTEYLPVSSTGHLILAADALNLGGFAHTADGEAIRGPLGPIMEPNPALNAFNVVIQIGAILAVVGIYFRRIREMCFGLIGRDSKGLQLLINLMAAFMPSAVIGLLSSDLIERYLFSPLTVAIALAVGGVAMIFTTKLYRRDEKHLCDLHSLTLRSALIIGCAQCLAMWPGTSRSMVTILAGLAVGLNLVAAAEFSFLLALPTLSAATLYKTVTQWDALTASVGLDSLLTGIIISTIVAAFSVRFLIGHLTKHGLAPFGVYRIALAAGVLYYFSQQF